MTLGCAILSGAYRLSPYLAPLIHREGQGRRVLQIPTVADRVVLTRSRIMRRVMHRSPHGLRVTVADRSCEWKRS